MITRRERPSCPVDDCPREHCADCPYSAAPRKPYAKPTVEPGDEETQISYLASRNPNM